MQYFALLKQPNGFTSFGMSEHLEKLIEAARQREMSNAEKEAQRQSFAFGNANIKNSRVTREMVDIAADKISRIHSG